MTYPVIVLIGGDGLTAAMLIFIVRCSPACSTSWR